MTTFKALKAKVDFRQLANETHPLTKSSKICCLWHEDRTPSLHLYENGYFCFVCGASGDHFSWLIKVRGLSFKDAKDYLEHFTRPEAFEGKRKDPKRKRFQPAAYASVSQHFLNAKRLKKVPLALERHGFSLKDCKRIGAADLGGDAVFPILDTYGQVLALKRRFHKPKPHRYVYLTPGQGAPAWCSPNGAKSKCVLIVEGELNAVMCWLALKQTTRVCVIGTAGAHASFYKELVNAKTVYLYADNDDAGNQAIHRWAEDAFKAGAKKVYRFKPWGLDACEVVNAFGKRSLYERLLWGEKTQLSPSFDAEKRFKANLLASKESPLPSHKPHLAHTTSHAKTDLASGAPSLHPPHDAP